MDHPFHILTKAPATPRVQPTVTAPSESKPRKPNSEVRKQQNRIASRNYREKRKRKLQQLQQLLDDGDDDNSSEARGQTRSVSPYDNRSCSGSATYEQSVASVSPHIHATAMPGHLSSPRPDYTSHATPTWTASDPLYNQDSLAYPLAYSESQQMMAYKPRENMIAEYATLNANLPDFDSGYATSVSTHGSMVSSHASSWASAAYQNVYVQPQRQQQAFAAQQASPWQHHMMEGSARVDPYGRKYNSYEPQ